MRQLSEQTKKKLQEANKLNAVINVIHTSVEISRSTQDVLRERFYQVYEKGYTPYEDKDYKPGDLSSVSAFLLTGNRSDINFNYGSYFIDKLDAKPNREKLIIAAAFILAELDADEVRNYKKGV